jgi:hypothetical protein
MPSGLTRDETRTAGLLFGEELALGIVEPEALRVPEVRQAVRGLAVPSRLSRRFQRAQMRRERLTYQRHCVAPYVAARRAVLGDAAEGRPKLVIRVDGFPHHEAWDHPAGRSTADAAAVLDILRAAGVPFLVAVPPRVARRPLDPRTDEWREHDAGERELLAELRRDGVSFAVQGLDHRTRRERAAQRSEFTGRRRKETEERLDAAQAALRDEALHADVFVPPFDRFDASCWPSLAARFDIVCGGPASVDTMGFHPTPTWRGEAVWLPSYAPLHGPAAAVLPAARELLEQQTALWVPVTLRWDVEHDAGGEALRELCELLAAEQLARPWDDLRLAIRASHSLGALTA